jgi:adenylate cyclase
MSERRAWRRARGLRQKLLELSTTLTGIGVVLLVIGLVAVFWLRASANQLALTRAPAVEATQRAQVGLQRSLAGLRGWVVLEDEAFREERTRAWKNEIAPSIRDVHALAESWPEPEDQTRLERLSELLVELRESQWWVEDVAGTDGNRPAERILRQRVGPISTALRRTLDAMFADANVSLEGLAALSDFRQALAAAEAALARFVVFGEDADELGFTRSSAAAAAALARLSAEVGAGASLASLRLRFVERELPWYRRFAADVVAARRAPDWDVARHRMSAETVPLTAEVLSLLDALATSQSAMMRQDTLDITFAGNSAVVLALVLITLMALIGYALASYRASQITQPIEQLSHATKELAAGRLRRDLPITTDDELGRLTDAFNSMRVRLQQSEAALMLSNEQLNEANADLERHNRFVRETFGRYLSDDVVASLLDTPEGLRLGGESREVSIVMTDLRGFTSLAARLDPSQVVVLLNRYLGEMVDVITRYGGTIDEFIGDAILIIFGAPVASDDHAVQAVACAAAMQLAMDGVNAQNLRDGLPEVEMGIGVNTGEVVVGNIGSATRAKYGVVGSTVNFTSRIESYTVGGQILISQATRDALGARVRLGDAISIEAKGLDGAATVYDVRGVGAPFDLFLPDREGELATLDPGVPVSFVELEGKHLGRDAFGGTLVRASARRGEVLSDRTPPPLTNLKLDVSPELGPRGTLYAKVVGPLGETGFVVSFTSTPPELRSWLESLA